MNSWENVKIGMRTLRDELSKVVLQPKSWPVPESLKHVPVDDWHEAVSRDMDMRWDD